MAIAGRSYANVPVIIRGSLEDADDFNSRTSVLVVSSQPSQAQTATPPVTVLRATLADPPVLTTPAPVVIAAPGDPRWFSGAVITVAAAPQAPAAPASPAPVPVVIAAPPDGRWFSGAAAQVLAAPQPPPPTPAPVVVSSQPAPAQTAAPAVTIVRSTLQDPPVLTTAAPVVAAAPADPRWFAGAPPQVLAAPQAPAAPAVASPAPVVVAGATDRRWFSASPATIAGSPQAPAVVAAATPAPVVVAAQPPSPKTAQAFITRSTLADPPVLTTASPVVIAAPADRRWYSQNPVTVLASPQPALAVFTAAPGPVVVTSQVPWPRTVQATIVRSTLADPAVLTTAGPVVVAAATDRRWLAGRPPLVLANGPAYTPPAASRGLLMAAFP